MENSVCLTIHQSCGPGLTSAVSQIFLWSLYRHFIGPRSPTYQEGTQTRSDSSCPLTSVYSSCTKVSDRESNTVSFSLRLVSTSPVKVPTFVFPELQVNSTLTLPSSNPGVLSFPGPRTRDHPTSSVVELSCPHWQLLDTYLLQWFLPVFLNPERHLDL